MTNHRRMISATIFGIIIIVAFWSIINIATMARHYHPSNSTWLLGVGFGGANAISVYVLAIAKTKQLRWPAIFGALLFGVGSATIQYHLYVLEGAVTLVALAFGAMGPVAEAVLAWMEASLRMEMETFLADAVVIDKTPEMAKAPESPAPESPQVPKRTTPKTPVVRQNDNQKTPKQNAKIHQIVELAKSGRFGTDGELAKMTGWSATTARRYRSAAEEMQLITRNGDGKFHPIRDGK